MVSESNEINKGVAAHSFVTKWWQYLMNLPNEFSANVVNTMLQLKKVGKEDPRRVIHSLKVALAITLVSIFYYFKPLYQSFGSFAMWAVITVVVVSEFSVGATLGKGINRGIATFLAGVLGLGSYHIVHSISRGNIMEPILLGFITCLATAGVTYLRFLPEMKARYDYGLLVFILTFCLVSVSSYRDHEILNTAKERVTTILVGGLISMLVCIFVCPVWAGDDLHNLVSKNIEKLGDFLQGFGDEYFGTTEDGESNKSFMQGYKSVLNSKQVEDNLTNFARWEPCPGRFTFRYPWQQYQKIGNLSRECACRIDSLNGFLNNFTKTPKEIRNKIEEPCIKMTIETGKALKQLAMSIHKMIPPSAADIHIAKSKIYATNLRSIIKTKLWEDTNLFEIVAVLTVASLLLDVVSSIEKLAESIQELSTLAKFKNKESKVAAVYSESDHQEEVPQPFCCDNSGPQHVIIINSTKMTHNGSSVDTV